MGRNARLARVVMLLALVAGACSGGDGSAAVGSSIPTTSVGAGATTTGPGATTTVAPGASPTTSVTTPPTPAATTTTATPTAAGPVSVTAGGWRMVISRPSAGSTTGPVLGLCYEVTGSTRESTVAFDVSLLRSGTPTGAAGPFRAGAAVGRGLARVPLPGVTPGRYDVRIQLLLDGQALSGGAVTVPSVTVVDDAAVATC